MENQVLDDPVPDAFDAAQLVTGFRPPRQGGTHDRAALEAARRKSVQKVAAVWGFLGWERIGLARSLDADGNEQSVDNNFTVTGAQSMSHEDLSVRELMLLCLDENDRRFAGYDERLLRPQTMPKLTRLALRFMRKRKR
jgi:hypothetical protein